LLQKNLKKRLTIDQALQHRWFTNKKEASTIPLTKNVSKLKASQGKRKLLEATKALKHRTQQNLSSTSMFGFSTAFQLLQQDLLADLLADDNNAGSAAAEAADKLGRLFAKLANGNQEKNKQNVSVKQNNLRNTETKEKTKKDQGTTKQIDPALLPKSAKKAPILIRNEYEFKEVLGQGAFGLVREGIPKKGSNKEPVAIKEITRNSLSEDDDISISSEVKILEILNQEKKQQTFIVKLLDFYIEDYYYYIVMEKIVGGELFKRLAVKKTYNEKEARDLVRTLLSGIKHCHDNNVVHRDLKPRKRFTFLV
jgi:serine/threonine protein kinase